MLQTNKLKMHQRLIEMINLLKNRYLIILPIVFVILIAQIEKYEQLTTSGTFGAAIRLAIPICLAGLGGMFSERTGVVNIGLEGMMIMGTWFGAWGAYSFGPWYGVLAGIIGGALFGLIHAIATVSFQVDHIVSGVAINILAAGVARFLNVVAYSDVQNSATQSPRVDGDVGDFALPYLSGGFETPNLFLKLQEYGIPFISDFAGLFLGATSKISYISLFTLSLIPVAAWVLWSTSFGLQMRSVGELPTGSESLGVNVYLMKYIGVVISGGFAGLAGAYLVLESSGIYREGQTAGRGFIGLASMIFGNYRPFGIFMGSGLFGFADALQKILKKTKAVLLLSRLCDCSTDGSASFHHQLYCCIVHYLIFCHFSHFIVYIHIIPVRFGRSLLFKRVRSQIFNAGSVRPKMFLVCGFKI